MQEELHCLIRLDQQQESHLQPPAAAMRRNVDMAQSGHTTPEHLHQAVAKIRSSEMTKTRMVT
jgi:hypothetical protein